MTNYKQILKDEGSEYLYRDLGYGGFTANGEFMVEGKVVHPTKADYKEMYEREFGHLFAEARREFASYSMDDDSDYGNDADNFARQAGI